MRSEHLIFGTLDGHLRFPASHLLRFPFAFWETLLRCIGVPCFFLGMLLLYRVPKMASERMRVALEVRFIEYCIDQLVCEG